MCKHLLAPAIRRFGGICLSILLIGVFRIYAQEWTFQAGTNVSQFVFVNSHGIPLSGIKSGSGHALGVHYQRKWVDTSALLLKASPTAIYINQHPTLAKFLSRFQWGIGIESNQYNAIGDAFNTVYSYQTNYWSLIPSLQYRHLIYKGLSIHASGMLQVNRLFQGNQQVNNHLVDLMDDLQFNEMHIQGGFQVGVSQKLSDNIQLTLNVGQLSQMSPAMSQGTSLTIKPTRILFGIIFQPKIK